VTSLTVTRSAHRHHPQTADREICDCYLVEILKTSQQKISRHLAYQRKAGIASTRRDGKWMHYRLAIPSDQVAANILRGTLRHLKRKPEMRKDFSRLTTACCAPKKYALLQGAPQPAVLSAG
jgi:ArsR family transcriptional regulator, arsenate/arsenite/antimonite-responsive transcriptional repressor